MNLTDISNDNKTIELTSDELDKLQTCDYTSLFSHLPISFQLTQQNQQLIYHPHFDLEFQQQATYKLCFASVCILFGCFFAICGYRFLKVSTFIVGFSLGSSIIYLILSEQKQLTLVENLIISLSIGVLFAFVALLVQYIGLFLIGITSSISVVTCILILIDLFYTNKSAWLCIGLLFVSATIVASITLKFQKSLTIINTSIIGSALLLIAIDFFVENNLLVDYIYELYRVNGHMFKIYERQNALLKPSSLLLNTLKTVATTSSTTTGTTSSLLRSLVTTSSFTDLSSTNNTNINGISSSKALALFLRLYSSAHAKLCWYTWLIFSSFFILLFVSLLIQFLITGKNYDHRDSWQKLIRGSRRKKSANLEKIRLKSNLSESENTRHHHSSYNHNDGSSSSSNLELVPTKINNKKQNDQMLLVEESSRTKNYKITNSNENKQGQSSKQSSNKTNDNFEIISFEIIKPTNNKPRLKSKSKSSKNTTNNSDALKEKSNSASISTTTSTSSASSSSSTCQLIPLKLNSNTNPSLSTTTSAVTCPSLNGSPPKQHTNNSLIPPPVPTLPPPKLSLPSSITSSTLNSNTINTTNSLLPSQTRQLPKIKHHRNSVNNKSSDSSDKFRHLYQVRRHHGDALSIDFINNVQTKLSASNLNNNTGTTINEASSLNVQKTTSLTSNNKKSKSSK